MVRTYSVVVVLIFIISTCLLINSTAVPQDKGQKDRHKKEAHYYQAGPFKVKVLECRNLKDAARDNRSVPIKVHYPEAEGAFPLVVISHGGGGNWDAHLFQAQHLASYGYVVLCPEHVYSNNIRIKYYMSRRGGRMKYVEGLRRTLTDPQVILGRPKDVSFAIDQAILWNKNHAKLKGKINTKKIAVMGHSYGAYTTLVVCGARPILDYLKPVVKPGKGFAKDLSDTRVTLGLAMSPPAPGGTRFNQNSYKMINCPLVCLSGSKDISQLYRQGKNQGQMMPATSRLKMFDLLPAGQKYFLWLENADHLAFADSPKAWILPSKSRPDTQRISKAMMVIFCNHFLKQKKGAVKYLNESYVNSIGGNIVTSVQWFQR